EPGQIRCGLVVVLSKSTADNDELVRRLDGHRVDIAIGAIAEIYRRIRRAARQQARDMMTGQTIREQELANHDNPVVRLERDRIHRVTNAWEERGAEGGIHRPIGGEPRHPAGRAAIDMEELAAN